MYERLIHIRRQIFCFYIPIPSIYKRVMINEEAMYWNEFERRFLKQHCVVKFYKK